MELLKNKGYLKKGTFLYTSVAQSNISVSANTALPIVNKAIFNDSTLITKISSTQFSLKSGVKYKIEIDLHCIFSTITNYLTAQLYDVTNSAFVGSKAYNKTSNYSAEETTGSSGYAIITPSSNSIFEIRVTATNASTISLLEDQGLLYVEEVEAYIQAVSSSVNTDISAEKNFISNPLTSGNTSTWIKSGAALSTPIWDVTTNISNGSLLTTVTNPTGTEYLESSLYSVTPGELLNNWSLDFAYKVNSPYVDGQISVVLVDGSGLEITPTLTAIPANGYQIGRFTSPVYPSNVTSFKIKFKFTAGTYTCSLWVADVSITDQKGITAISGGRLCATIDANYTLDSQVKLVLVNTNNAVTVIIPSGLPVGKEVTVQRISTGLTTNLVTIACAGEGTTLGTIGSASVADTTNSLEIIVLRKITATTWSQVNGYDSGANSNGRYIKYADGTMECFIVGKMFPCAGQALSTVKFILVNLPHPFIDSNYTISFTPISTDSGNVADIGGLLYNGVYYIKAVSSISTSSYAYKVACVYNVYFDMSISGRWK